jgi:sucrose-6-phosphate hydrolase SacC (GH32 family)
MSLKFQDIMKNFYNDETLGIKAEDAPANATGAAVAGTGDDNSVVVVKKKKKKLYDGRTREARSFLKRMETLRAKRESKLAKKVQENTDNFGVEHLLAEDNIAILKNIVKNKQNNKIKMKDGTMRIDLFTASALTQALDQVKPDTKKKMMDIINKGGKSQLMKLVSVVMK